MCNGRLAAAVGVAGAAPSTACIRSGLGFRSGCTQAAHGALTAEPVVCYVVCYLVDFRTLSFVIRLLRCPAPPFRAPAHSQEPPGWQLRGVLSSEVTSGVPCWYLEWQHLWCSARGGMCVFSLSVLFWGCVWGRSSVYINSSCSKTALTAMLSRAVCL